MNSILTPSTYCKSVLSIVISRHFGKYFANWPALKAARTLTLLFVSGWLNFASLFSLFLFWGNDLWTKNPHVLAGLVEISDFHRNTAQIAVNYCVVSGFVVAHEELGGLSS